jgi:hypothetical protein
MVRSAVVSYSTRDQTLGLTFWCKGVMFLSGDVISVDSEVSMMTLSIARPVRSVSRTIGGDHGVGCACVHMGECTHIFVSVCIVFRKKIWLIC